MMEMLEKYNVVSEDNEYEHLEAILPSYDEAFKFVIKNLDRLEDQLNFWIEKVSGDDELLDTISKESILSEREQKLLENPTDDHDAIEAGDDITEEEVSLLTEGYHVYESSDDGNDKYYITTDSLMSAIEYMDINCLIDDRHYIIYVDLTGTEVERYDKEAIAKSRIYDAELEKTVENTRNILSQPLQQQQKQDETNLQQLLAEVLLEKNEGTPKRELAQDADTYLAEIAEIHSMSEIIGEVLNQLDTRDASVKMALHCNEKCIDISASILKRIKV